MIVLDFKIWQKNKRTGSLSETSDFFLGSVSRNQASILCSLCVDLKRGPAGNPIRPPAESVSWVNHVSWLGRDWSVWHDRWWLRVTATRPLQVITLTFVLTMQEILQGFFAMKDRVSFSVCVFFCCCFFQNYKLKRFKFSDLKLCSSPLTLNSSFMLILNQR